MSSLCITSENFEVIKPSKNTHEHSIPQEYLEISKHRIVINTSKPTVVSKEIQIESLIVNNSIFENFFSLVENKFKNSLGNFNKKTEAVAMSFQFPTAYLFFKEEIRDTFSDGIWFKLGFTSILSTVFSFAQVPVDTLVTGLGLFVLIALCDAVLGILPNAVRNQNDKKDHTLQAKLWSAIGHLLGMTIGVGIHLFLETVIKDPNVVQSIAVNCHYYIFTFVCSIYFYRVVRYIAALNKAKVPKVFNNIFFKK